MHSVKVVIFVISFALVFRSSEGSEDICTLQMVCNNYLNENMLLFIHYFEELPREIKQYIFSFMLEKSMMYNFELSQWLQNSVLPKNYLIGPAVYNSDGTEFLVGSYPDPTRSSDFTAYIGDTATGSLKKQFKGHFGPIDSALYSSDGKRVLTCSWDCTARLWDAETTEGLTTFTGHTDCVYSAECSSDGKRVLTGSKDGTACLWCAQSGKELALFKNEEAVPVYKAMFHPTDSDTILTYSKDARIRFWLISSKSLFLTIEGRYADISLIAFCPTGASPNGTVLVAYDDGTAQLLKMEGQVIASEVLVQFEQTESRTMESAVFSPDGTKLLTVLAGSCNNQVCLWDVDSGKKVLRLGTYVSGPISAAFSHDGKKVLIGSNGTQLRQWEVRLDCPAVQWVLNKASLVHIWLIFQAIQAKKKSEVYWIAKKSFEYELLMTMPFYVQEYIKKWYSVVIQQRGKDFFAKLVGKYA